jgi:protoporphyrinogen oxidase
MRQPLRIASAIGGGIAGVSAALDLARRGAGVTVLERGSTLGGLVASFEIGGTPIERFYHHVFPHERHVLKLVDELGLSESLGWYESSVGIYAQGRVWPFTSPVDLLRFEPLPLVDRLATGVGALRLGRTRRWEPLDEVPAGGHLMVRTDRPPEHIIDDILALLDQWLQVRA